MLKHPYLPFFYIAHSGSPLLINDLTFYETVGKFKFLFYSVLLDSILFYSIIFDPLYSIIRYSIIKAVGETRDR
jgi:hypothetical protein